MATGSVWLCVSMCVSGFNHHQIELCVQVIKVVPNRLRLRGTSQEVATTVLPRLASAAGDFIPDPLQVLTQNLMQLPLRVHYSLSDIPLNPGLLFLPTS